jgi:hypothetical protein
LPRALAGNACEGITTTPATRVSDYATLAELLITYVDNATRLVMPEH